MVVAEDKAEFKRILMLSPTDHITLDVAVLRGDVTISYSRSGEISVFAAARAIDATNLPTDFFDSFLTVERDGSHVKVRTAASAVYASKAIKISYVINVPRWIEVNSTVQDGKQSVSGVMGPVKLIGGNGDIAVSYVTTSLAAKTDSGNIKVVRVGAAAEVETGSGNINLKDIGPASVAIVRKGTGRIEMDGVSGGFTGSTDAGELDARGGVFDNWDLKSTSGNIRIGLPSEGKFEIDAVTRAGLLSSDNGDIDVPRDSGIRECHRKVNGGGKRVSARSDTGNIVILQ